MSENSTTVTFIQNHVPALESGQYKVEVTQTITTVSTVEAIYTAQQSFYVSGKRYSLEAGDVNSVYPPLGSAGQFDQSLTQIVLNSSSLPWQRSTGFTGQLTGNNKAPWLALLLFDESENTGAPQQVTLAELVTNNQTFFPPRTSEAGEDSSQTVNVIDVPLNLYNAIVPSVVDLQWLAHVRKVSAENKSTSGDAAAGDTYAVITGNRLPEANRVSTVHLVSLENYNDYLPGEFQAPNENFPPGISMVRLVSLYSWSFRCTPELQSFGGLLMSADMNPPVLQMPFTTDAGASSTANQSVENAFGMGYTAMNHKLRNGDRTVSWYRGPLLPLGTPPFLVPPYNSADELMRYDPTLGMLDATYASAWQLGKLMALHDDSYVKTLVRWKASQTETSAQSLEEAIIDEEFNLPESNVQEAGFKKQARISSSIKDVVRQLIENRNSASNT